MRKGKITVVGSSNTDMVVRADRQPRAGETIMGGAFMMAGGGKGANQAVATARLGADVSFVCKTGDDMFRSQAIEAYRKEGIDTRFVSVDAESASGVALITVSNDGENTIVVAPGANARLSAKDIDDAAEVIDSADIVLLQLEVPIATVEYAARRAKQAGAKVVLNPAPAAEIPVSLYESIDLIIPNRTEAETLTGMVIDSWESAEKATQILSARGVKDVIITLGGKGALVYTDSKAERVEAFKVDAVDTTAAGDTFCGALCVALTEGQPLLQAVRFASAASAISVGRMGAQPSIPQREEVQNMLNNL